MNKKVLLISFYNPKAMGLRYLDKALQTAGYEVHTVFFKRFHSAKPKTCTAKEISLLLDVIDDVDPGMIGLSIMSTFYLETVLKVNKAIRGHVKTPVVWGGVYPTLFPHDCLMHCDYVVRGEGEHAIVELARAIRNKDGFQNLENVGYNTPEGVALNDFRPLGKDPDEFGVPEIGGDLKCSIDRDRLTRGDPQLHAISYELAATKGCPFACSYCSSANIRRLYKGKGKYIRYRKVSSVIQELLHAKNSMKNLRYIRFWDEIFSDDEQWVREFCHEYRKHINLPFEIWSHPLKVREKNIRLLVDAGLHKVVMGIQSGSQRVLRDIFHRYEQTHDIIKACTVLHRCKVPEVVYDFILMHPFETEGDLIATYELCRRIPGPFELQIHGLNFLPGTDIVKIALERNVVDYDKLNKIMFGTMEEQFGQYWSVEHDHPRFNFWVSLIRMSQLKWFAGAADFLALRSNRRWALKAAGMLSAAASKTARLRHLIKKGNMVTRTAVRQGAVNRRFKASMKKSVPSLPS